MKREPKIGLIWTIIAATAAEDPFDQLERDA